MVEGMKQEARRYLAADGTVVEYGKRLTERQDAEIAIYNRVKADIENARKTMCGSAFMRNGEWAQPTHQDSNAKEEINLPASTFNA